MTDGYRSLHQMIEDEKKETETWKASSYRWMHRTLYARDKIDVLKKALLNILRYSRQPNSMGAVGFDYQEELKDIRSMVRDALKELEKE